MNVAFSADGNRVASSDRNGKVKVWDARNGDDLFSLDMHKTYDVWLAFSADSRKLAAASRRRVIICDASNGELLSSTRIHYQGKRDWWSVALDRDLKQFATGG